MLGKSLSFRRGLMAAAVVVPMVAHISSAVAEEGKLSFLAAEYSAISQPFWEKTVAAFEAANPWIDVTLEVVGWNTMHDTTAQRIPPEPSLTSSTPQHLGAGMGRWGSDPPARQGPCDREKADFVPALFEKAPPTRARAGACLSPPPRGLFYNDELLQQAGLDTESSRPRPGTSSRTPPLPSRKRPARSATPTTPKACRLSAISVSSCGITAAISLTRMATPPSTAKPASRRLCIWWIPPRPGCGARPARHHPRGLPADVPGRRVAR